MSQVCIVVLVLFKFAVGYPGENVVLYPSNVQAMDSYFTPQFRSNRDTLEQQPMLHTNFNREYSPRNLQNMITNDFKDTLDGAKMSYKELALPQYRTAVSATRDSNGSAYRPYPGPYPVPTPAYGPPGYQNTSPPAPPTSAVAKAPVEKPDLPALFQFKPVTTKVVAKGGGSGSGLLGLIPSLFSGSSSGGLGMSGLKDIVINSILKPLLEAKGGIKTLMGKLAIPLIALVLINLEVLVVIWWMWEDCPIEKPPEKIYPYPKPAYNYNNYNSYR